MATRGHTTGRTAAIAAPSGDMSVSIRKISNGFIIRRSGSRRGKYIEHEEFSATDPLKGKAPAKEKR